MLLAVGWLATGCSTISSMNPVNWWHRQQGGKIAEQRPPPPGADQPYPNMATVPAKPDAPDAEALKKLTASLVADRTNAQHAAQSAPLADPSSPAASPSLFGVGTAPPPPPPTINPRSGNPPAASGAPGPPVASASMPAVSAPPSPDTPPSAAPRKAVQAAPLEAPPAEPVPSGQPTTTPGAPTPAAPPPVAATAPPAGTAGTDMQPTLPAAPPSRPAAAGAPPAPPVAPAPMPAPSAGPFATIVFAEGASSLSQPATDEVKTFAARRGKATIAITGYGDSASSDPDAQSTALDLGLSRAQSIVEALKQAGVPGTAIRVGAEASGRGASLRLLE